MKSKKNGFTLVELLAVIVILAVILIIAVPQIQSVIKDAKLGSIESTAKLIASSAESVYESKKALGLEVGKLKCTDVASLSDDYGDCKLTLDDSGVATVVINGKKGGKFDNLACSGTKDNMSCAEGSISTTKKCTTTDTLKQGLKFVDGQYTYTYKKQLSEDMIFENMDDDGWSVVLTDKESTDPVTTELCGTINDKPIVSMSGTFYGSKATSIDVSSFDTSNVINMMGMFAGTAATEIKGLNNLDTSNVTNMMAMFFKSTIASLNLSSFDTSNVTNMTSMFYQSTTTSIDLSSFDTSNVTSMLRMFNNSAAKSLNLSNFNTSKVTNMAYMFYGSAATEIKGLDKFNTGSVTNMKYMFTNTNVTSLNLSNFDTSKVTDMYGMFGWSKATSIDVSSFNTSSVTDMSRMFYYTNATEIKGLTSFNTAKVTTMYDMFGYSQVETLDLSSFDTSVSTNNANMFTGSKATKGYARSQAEADRFNATSNKPSTLKFVVKS